MKVVLFCAGLGMRIREYSQDIPKPLMPIGEQPILSHIMDYYGEFGHREFLLCLGYKANAISDFFRCRMRDLPVPIDRGELVSGPGGEEISLIDTGPMCNIGQRLWAVRGHLANEEMFMANYSDGLTDVDLDDVIERFKRSGKVACFLAVRPPLTYHVAEIAEDGRVQAIKAAADSEIWINGGYFVFRREIFDYMREGEELVVEPFRRLIEADQLLAYKHDGFWRSMDTLRDKEALEDMIRQGQMPWRVQRKPRHGGDHGSSTKRL